jgi:hypothetical protein
MKGQQFTVDSIPAAACAWGDADPVAVVTRADPSSRG